jgi:hypothetical protein
MSGCPISLSIADNTFSNDIAFQSASDKHSQSIPDQEMFHVIVNSVGEWAMAACDRLQKIAQNCHR